MIDPPGRLRSEKSQSMSENNSHILKSSAGPAVATLLSRILGLVRTMFEAAVIGGGVYATAWNIAFIIPNLFRRLLGEGALGTALIPIITHTEEQRGRDQVRRDLSIIFVVLSGILATIVVIVTLLAYVCRPLVTSEHGIFALHLLPFLMPYSIFICLTGVIGAILNSRQVFFLPSLGALLLNIFLIAGLGAGFAADIPHNTPDFVRFLEKLAYLVLLSGILQMLLTALLLWKKGLFPSFAAGWRNNRQVLGELWKLVLPGLIGAAAVQVSFSIDLMLASYLGEMAVPALTNTGRIIDLPIGIFAISLGTVLMSNMSNAAAKNDFSQIAKDLLFGLRHVGFVCIPMAVFFIVFREPIMRLTFLRGNFTPEQLGETMYVAIFYGAGIPAFCSLKIILPAFYARKQMTRPLCVSLLCIVVNLVLNLILMWPLRQGGIALATVISSVLNNTILIQLLRREGIHLPLRRLFIVMGRALTASAAAALIWFVYPALSRLLHLPLADDLAALLTAAAGFSLIYLVAGRILGGVELSELFSIFKSKVNHKR